MTVAASTDQLSGLLKLLAAVEVQGTLECFHVLINREVISQIQTLPARTASNRDLPARRYATVQTKHDYSCHKNVQYRRFVVPNAVKTNGYIQDQASVQRTNASQSVQSTDACGDNNGGPPTGDP